MLEVGKYHVTRSGEIIKITGIDTDPFVARCYVAEDGTHYYSNGDYSQTGRSSADIISVINDVTDINNLLVKLQSALIINYNILNIGIIATDYSSPYECVFEADKPLLDEVVRVFNEIFPKMVEESTRRKAQFIFE